MKKISAYLIVLVLGVAIIWFSTQTNQSPESSTSSIAASEKVMAFDPELQEALDIMSGLQSLSLDTPSISSDEEIKILGEKVIKIEKAFSFNEDRITVLKKDRSYFEGEMKTHLDRVFGSASVQDFEDFIYKMKQPSFFISSYSSYSDAVYNEILQTNAFTQNNPTQDIMDIRFELSEKFFSAAFEVTKDTREILARSRGDAWLKKYKQNLCITNDPIQDIYTKGVIKMIKFYEKDDGSIAYSTALGKEDICTTANSGDLPPSLEQHSCINNQLTSDINISACDHGCSDGACNKPRIVATCDGLTLSPTIVHPGDAISYVCSATNATSYQVKVFQPDLLEYGTFTTSTGVVETSSLNPGVYQVSCLVDDTIMSSNCSQTFEIIPETPTPTLSHFELFKANEMIDDNPDTPETYAFDLVVIAKKSDGSIATDYNGNGLILVSGDDQAQYPQQVNLKTTNGVGIFPITLSTRDNVGISYKDVDNHINGHEQVSDLETYIDSDKEFCTKEYAPVCGEIQVQCVKAPCDPVRETYGNACMAEKAGAKIVYKGKCSVPGVSTTALDPISGGLYNGIEEVYGVRVSVSQAKDIALYSLRFHVETLGNTHFDSPTLIDQNGDSMDYICSGADIVECVYDGIGELASISAGASETFYLQGSVTNVQAQGDEIHVRMSQMSDSIYIDDNNNTAGVADLVHRYKKFAIVWTDAIQGSEQDMIQAKNWFGDYGLDIDNTTVTNESHN